LPINVASTGPSHISIFTGANPSETGIVGNSFRKRDQKWGTPFPNAFRQHFDTETIFQAAMRQGKKVITIGGVGLDNTHVERKTDYMHMYPIISGPSLVIDLIGTDTIININNTASYRKLTPSNDTPSQPFLRISGHENIPLSFYMVDTLISVANILHTVTQIKVDNDGNVKNGFLTTISPNEWVGLPIDSQGKLYNTSFKLLKSDASKDQYTIYMTAPAEVYGHPAGFLEQLQSHSGLWPGEPDNLKATSGLVSEEFWFEQTERLAQHSKELIISGMKEKDWDLLFGYFSTLDDVLHRYTLTNPRQIDYKAENGERPKRYALIVENWFKKMDQYLLEIMAAAPEGTNFVIFSDHGMIPIHTTMLLNNYLERSGFMVSQNEINSVTSGTSAHIYVNKEVITPLKLPEYLERLKAKLIDLKDSVSGLPIFELVANHADQKKYGLYHEDYSGDFFVSCSVGFSISHRYLPDIHYLVRNSFDPAMFTQESQATQKFLLNGTMNETGRGVHGNLANMREGQAVFYAIGPQVPKRKIKLMDSLQIAPTVAKILGIKPPERALLKSVI
jgi:predicted AlkP superfamily pyrophosphatase or phosphodiesterase